MARTWAPKAGLSALFGACLWAAFGWQSVALASVTAPPKAAPQASTQASPTDDAQTDAPASAADIAKARARADEVIAKGHAQDYFLNITDGAAPKLRHRASGMECVFGVTDPAFIYVYPTPGIASGDDVSCTSVATLATGQKIIWSLYATRPTKMDELEPLLARMVAELKADMPDAAPAEQHFTSLNLAAKKGADVPTHRAARFQATTEGHPVYARAAVGVVNGWVVSQRTTAPMDIARPADMMSEVVLGVAMADVFYAKPDKTGD